jgi:hypothetical protein
MEVQVAKLKQALALVKPAVATRATLPVTQCVRMGGGLLVAFDLDKEITVQMPELNRDLVAPHRLLADIVAGMPHGLVEIAWAQQGLELSCQNRTFNLNVRETVQDFPPLVQVQPGCRATLNGDHLKRLFKDMLVAVADEEHRPVLTCVLLETGPEPMLAGADGFRLAYAPLGQALPTLGEPAPEAPPKGHRRAEAPAPSGKTGQLLVPGASARTFIQLWDNLDLRTDGPRALPSRGCAARSRWSMTTRRSSSAWRATGRARTWM